MLSVLLLVINLSFAGEPSINALKTEIKRLKHENNELTVQVGDLQAEVDELTRKVETAPPFVVKHVPVLVKVRSQNRLSVLGGVGQLADNLDSGYVMGMQYQRMINDRVSVGGQVQSNQSVLMSLGLEF